MFQKDIFKNSILKAILTATNIGFPEVTLLDVTLRDGGFEISFDWKEDFVRKFAMLCASCGMNTIEIGYLGGVKKEDGWYDGFAADIPGKFIKDITEKYNALNIVAIITPWRLKREIDFLEYQNVGLSLLRIAYNQQFADHTWQVISQASAAGIPVCLNITNIAKYRVDDLKELISQTAKKGIFKISLADTTSGLTPEKVSSFSPALNLAKELGIQLGFHGHDVLGFGNANALQFIKMGITTIDVSFGGLGRGGKNLMTETWMMAKLLELQKPKLSELFQISELVSRTVNRSPQNLVYMLFSFFGISPEFLESIEIKSEEDQYQANNQIGILVEKLLDSRND